MGGMDRLTGDFKGASMFATVEQARIYNKLRKYEDTGLTPDEIAALREENERLRAAMRDVVWMLGPDFSDIGTAVTCRQRLSAALEKDARVDPAPRYHPCQRCGSQAPCPNGCERQRKYESKINGLWGGKDHD